MLRDEGVERLPGAHCYQVFAGQTAFDELMAEEPATFFLTDFLARHFDRLVVRGLGLDRHPELLPVYFGAYRRVVYLAQTDDPRLLAAARAAAARLGLRVRAAPHRLRRPGHGHRGARRGGRRLGPARRPAGGDRGRLRWPAR